MDNNYGPFTEFLAAVTTLDDIDVDNDDALLISVYMAAYDMRRSDVKAEIDKLNAVVEKVKRLVNKYEDQLEPEQYSEMMSALDKLKMEIKE